MLLNEFLPTHDPYLAKRREVRRRAEEEEQINDKMSHEFNNDRTSMDEFDPELVKKIVAVAVKKSTKLNQQGDEMLQTWQEKLHPGAYLDNDEFNNLYKKFEQLQDSNDTPLIQFNKLYSLTKELVDAAEEFDNWKDSDDATEWKNQQGHY